MLGGHFLDKLLTWRDNPTVVGFIPGKVVLNWIRKQTEQAMESDPLSRIPSSPPPSALIPAPTSFNDRL